MELQEVGWRAMDWIDLVQDMNRRRYLSIAICYCLDGPGIDSRWGARFSAHFQTCPGAHPAFCTIGTGSLSRGYSGRAVALTTHPPI